MLTAFRVLVDLSAVGLLSGAMVLAVACVRRVADRRLLTRAAAGALLLSYASLLVCAASLTADLAADGEPFRWYATPLLALGVVSGWAFLVEAWRRRRA